MFYRLDHKYGKETIIDVKLCETHYKHFKYRTYFEISEDDKCCSILYDGTRCQEVAVSNYNGKKFIRPASLSEINEVKRVFKNYLKIFKFSQLQFENFNRFVYLILTTLVHDVFNTNHNISSPIETKLKVQYSYFLEKLHRNFENFQIENINLTNNLNDILPKRLKVNALHTIPKKQYKLSKEHTAVEKKMYRNYVIFVNLLFALNDRTDRGKVYCDTFYKESIEEHIVIKTFYEIFKALFNQTELVKERDFPKIHFLMEEQFSTQILPTSMLNILYHYDKNLLEDSFQ